MLILFRIVYQITTSQRIIYLKWCPRPACTPWTQDWWILTCGPSSITAWQMSQGTMLWTTIQSRRQGNHICEFSGVLGPPVYCSRSKNGLPNGGQQTCAEEEDVCRCKRWDGWGMGVLWGLTVFVFQMYHKGNEWSRWTTQLSFQDW